MSEPEQLIAAYWPRPEAQASASFIPTGATPSDPLSPAPVVTYEAQSGDLPLDYPRLT